MIFKRVARLADRYRTPVVYVEIPGHGWCTEHRRIALNRSHCVDVVSADACRIEAVYRRME